MNNIENTTNPAAGTQAENEYENPAAALGNLTETGAYRFLGWCASSLAQRPERPIGDLVSDFLHYQFETKQ